jgi:anti-sigma B factor antagonist
MNVRSERPPTSDAPHGSGERVAISRRVVGAVTVVSLAGELDARTARVAHERLSGVLPIQAPVLLDLSQVHYVSSAGLRTMLMVYRQAQRMGTPIALVGVSSPLRSILSATGFLRFFRIVDSVPDGVAVLRDE